MVCPHTPPEVDGAVVPQSSRAVFPGTSPPREDLPSSRAGPQGREGLYAGIRHDNLHRSASPWSSEAARG